MTPALKLSWLSMLIGAWAREESHPECMACLAIMDKAVVMKDGARIKPAELAGMETKGRAQ